MITREANDVWRKMRRALQVPEDEPVVSYAKKLVADLARLKEANARLREALENGVNGMIRSDARDEYEQIVVELQRRAALEGDEKR